jgi:integrase
MRTVDSVNLFLLSRTGRRPKTKDWYAGCLGVFADTCPELPLRPEEIDMFLSRLKCGDERTHGYFRAIRALYRFLERRQYIPMFGNPVRMMEAPRVSRKVPRPLTPDAIRRLLQYPHPPKVRAALLLLAATGCRLDEVRTLAPDCFLETQMGPLVRVNGKRGERVIPLPVNTYHEIINLLPFSWTMNHMSWVIRKAFQAAGVQGSAINLRHSFATWWEGEDLALQAIMGHSSLATTRRYRQIRTDYLVRQYHQHAPLLAIAQSPERML